MADTIEGLKERRGWLLKQVELTDRAIEKLMEKAHAPRPPKPMPQELPGVPPAPASPPRTPSVHEENHVEFQAARRERFAQLGIDYVPDEQNTVAFVVVTMKRLRDACRDDDELFALIDAFCRDSWAAGCTPPYPLKALGAKVVFGRLLEELRGATPARPH
jgi:hypothetical protein